MFQTEFKFTLPKGYLDINGELQKEGIMRLATAADEILPLRDPRVQQNPGYLTIILLSRVVVRIGNNDRIDTKVIESLYTADLAYLQDLYEKINSMEMPTYKAACPHCGKNIDVPINFMNADQ